MDKKDKKLLNEIKEICQINSSNNITTNLQNLSLNDTPEYDIINGNKIYKKSTKVMAHWATQKYEYYPASIVFYHPTKRIYKVAWADGDETDTIVQICDVFQDKVPDDKDVKVGSTVLFPQGTYRSPLGVPEKRYHQGEITNKYKNKMGIWLYDGYHKFNAFNGKWCDYSGYAFEFQAMPITELRLYEGTQETTSTSKNKPSEQLYSNGTQVITYWAAQPYAYFESKIISYSLETNTYQVAWQDGDTSFNIINSEDVYENKNPNPENIEIGSNVFFCQGSYQHMGNVNCKHWHKGEITRKYKTENQWLFDGVHIYGQSHGKHIAYRNYSQQFIGYNVNQIRVYDGRNTRAESGRQNQVGTSGSLQNTEISLTNWDDDLTSSKVHFVTTSYNPNLLNSLQTFCVQNNN
jgi:hypothetical protein